MRQILIPLNKRVHTCEWYLSDFDETYFKFVYEDEPFREGLLAILRTIVKIVHDSMKTSGYIELRYENDGSFNFVAEYYKIPLPAGGNDKDIEKLPDAEIMLKEAENIGIEMTISERRYEGFKKRTA